jgi:hypothetical protein
MIVTLGPIKRQPADNQALALKQEPPSKVRGLLLGRDKMRRLEDAATAQVGLHVAAPSLSPYAVKGAQ